MRQFNLCFLGFATLGGTSPAIHFMLDVLPGLAVAAHEPDLRSTAFGLFADFVNPARPL